MSFLSFFNLEIIQNAENFRVNTSHFRDRYTDFGRNSFGVRK